MEPYKLNNYLIRDPEDKRDYLFDSTLMESVSPISIDHTNLMSPVKDQGSLGSCVAFAMCAMKEWQENKEHAEEVAAGKKDHRGGKKQDLSEQWIYYNCKKIDDWPGVQGTSIRYGMKVLQKIGVPCEDGWKYNDMVVGEPEHWAKMVSRWNKIGTYKRITNVDELTAALVNGPVPIGIPVFREFFMVGGGGFVADPANPNECYGGHAICAVGYSKAGRRIKFKNSWGRGWGRSGYGYLSFDYINNYLWDAWTCEDISVSNDMLSGPYEDLTR